jgi:hypothetical protein
MSLKNVHRGTPNETSSRRQRYYWYWPLSPQLLHDKNSLLSDGRVAQFARKSWHTTGRLLTVFQSRLDFDTRASADIILFYVLSLHHTTQLRPERTWGLPSP